MGKKKKLKELVKRLREENDDLKAELEDRIDQVLAYGEKLCALRETHAMQLAAISTASIQNTMSTSRDHRLKRYLAFYRDQGMKFFMSMLEIFEKSEVLFYEYLETVSADEFLALYDECENYEGLTVDQWLGSGS